LITRRKPPGTSNYKVTSFDLKLALLQYFRFKRQCVCVDEFRGADVIVDTGKEILEIEVKVSKSDLINGERAKANKHQMYKIGRPWGFCHPNKFLFCVPEKLVNVAKAWSKEINEKYGVIGFGAEALKAHISENLGVQHWEQIWISKSAKSLHGNYDDKLRRAIALRTSAKIATLMRDRFVSNVTF